MSDDGALEQIWNRWTGTNVAYRTLSDNVMRALIHAAFGAGFAAGLVLAERRAHPSERALYQPAHRDVVKTELRARLSVTPVADPDRFPQRLR